MNLGELQNLTASLLDDLKFGYFTKPQVTVFLNNAQRTVQKMLLQAGQNFYVKCVETMTDTSSCSYALPLDFLKLHRLEIVLNAGSRYETRFPLPQITLNQIDLLTFSPAQPTNYYFKKNRLVLAPPPQTPQTMRLFYSYLVGDMIAETSVPDVPETYHEFIAILAAEDGLIKDDRDASKLLNKKQFYEEMLKRDAQARGEDRPRTVNETDLYESYGILF